MDTGIDFYHEDLKDNIYVNPGEIPGNGIDDDSNGYADDSTGYDFANDDDSVYDSATLDKHGTHVAGILAAKGNQVGICGVSPNIKILPAKFINGNSGYISDAIESIEYCIKMGASIINCSWGSPNDSELLRQVMEESGVLYVCAAGNSAWDTTHNKIYPACYDIPSSIKLFFLQISHDFLEFHILIRERNTYILQINVKL